MPAASPIPCHRCGYDLAGLSEHALCPECATPVHDSVLRRWMAHSPRELRTIQVGAGLVLLSLLPGCALAGAWLLHTMGFRVNPPEALIVGTVIIAMLAWPAGWSVLAAPAPGGFGPGQEDCRFGLHAMSVIAAVPLAIVIIVLLIGGGVGILPCAGLLLVFLLPAMWLVGFGYIAEMARYDLRDRRLRRTAIAAALTLPVAIVGGLATLPVGPLYALMGLCLTGAAALVMLIRSAGLERRATPSS